jgi:hypothetical protein
MLQMARRPFMVPPLRYRAEIVKALLVPDLGPIRLAASPPFAAARRAHG